MDPEHPFRLGRFPLPCLGVGVERPYDGIQIFPWNDLFHLGQKPLQPYRFSVLFEGRGFGKVLLAFDLSDTPRYCQEEGWNESIRATTTIFYKVKVHY